MLRQYVNSFATTDTVDALNYYCTIHDHVNEEELSKGRESQRDICIKDLLLETRVLDIMNNQIGRVLTVRSPERDRLVTLASFIYQKYRQNVQVKDRTLLVTFEQLLSLISFFDLYHSGRFTEALSVL